MGEGVSAEETILTLVEDDDQKDLRQIGVVDKKGSAAAFTGEKCHEWAGHIIGDGYACQGNILIPGVVFGVPFILAGIRYLASRRHREEG